MSCRFRGRRPRRPRQRQPRPERAADRRGRARGQRAQSARAPARRRCARTARRGEHDTEPPGAWPFSHRDSCVFRLAGTATRIPGPPPCGRARGRHRTATSPVRCGRRATPLSALRSPRLQRMSVLARTVNPVDATAVNGGRRDGRHHVRGVRAGGGQRAVRSWASARGGRGGSGPRSPTRGTQPWGPSRRSGRGRRGHSGAGNGGGSRDGEDRPLTRSLRVRDAGVQGTKSRRCASSPASRSRRSRPRPAASGSAGP